MFRFLLSVACIFGALAVSAQCIQGDCVNGQGTYIYPSGAKYIGQFKNGEIHGIGVCYYTNGSHYRGEWAHRYPEGNGIKTYSDGTVRKGLWKKGKPIDEHGVVLQEYVPPQLGAKAEEINMQVGCLTGNCLNGEGTYAYADGSRYEGLFVQGKFEGQGKFFFANGDRYEGEFSQNYPNGTGTLHKSTGEVETGAWKNGEFVGGSLAVNGKTGCVEGDCQDGKGTFVFKAGAARYVGHFKNGQPDGDGVCTYANGDVYQGSWIGGAFGGKGTMVLNDGTIIAGYWKDGQFLGRELPATAEAPASPSVNNAAPLEKAKVWAVVVGVASYDHMPSLRYTDDDAYRFYAFLKSPEGGALPDEQVRILIDEDATREQVLTAMEAVFNRAGKNDLALFYFSGHGLSGSFLPIDFDGYSNKITHEEIAEIFNKCPAKYKLCVADACHSGSLFAMRSTAEESAISAYYSTLGQSVSGTALIMSSKAEETSLESSGLRQGVFSHFLIRGLKGEADKNQDKVVSISEIFQYVYEQVRTYTGSRQSPVLKGTFDPRMPISVIR